MGRHADPDSRHFYRSVAVSLGRGVLALAVVSLLVALLSLLGRPGGPGPIIVLDDPGAGPALEPPAEETVDASPDGTPTIDETPSPTTAPAPEPPASGG
jgi:hypothetical protein